MSYASIMVHMDLSPRAASRIEFAGALADRSGARLIGVAAMEPAVPMVSDTAFVDARIIENAESRAQEVLGEAEALFRKAAGPRNAVEWRSGLAAPAGFLCHHARAADLIVVGRQGKHDTRDWQLGVDPGDILMGAGRPVLVVPKGAEHVGSRVVIAWRNTRESRRAVWDALPLLKTAREVTLLSVGRDTEIEGVQDVAAWLARHEIGVELRVRTHPDGTVADEILRQVEMCSADTLVLGAYGHSRAREWIFGGVTLEILDDTPVACLMSH